MIRAVGGFDFDVELLLKNTGKSSSSIGIRLRSHNRPPSCSVATIVPLAFLPSRTTVETTVALEGLRSEILHRRSPE